METKQIYTSFIHWFGSHGKNYGFIVRPEDIDSFSKMSKYEKYEQGYYFHEENIIGVTLSKPHDRTRKN
ncbi:hypothetical protein [Sphaerospermopsis sp. LEGE 08334]|jgi:hypothetical protein|uniref:hypothetical protein n=1 Tax=Sphaerospermopsis sp. LEGE 08334 TaxID=1828651 RepID=UPI0018821A5E|nr:hypothetical protein [Sphaerospermopsis sp. LEGE 08334]MBE9055984.1 hypothetical protein [Sphaerospermopsis sp. LEGE 08334]